jgi:pimeloyl-ACP methyl ester carboxylesterase
VATLDLPGCGESGAPQDFSYTMGEQGDLAVKWVTELGLTRIILVGHSMGGVIGLYVAEALGSRVKIFVNLEGNLGRNDCTFSAMVSASSQEAFESHGFDKFKEELKRAVQKEPSPGLSKYYENVLKADPRSYYLSSVSLVRESCKGRLKERFLDLPMKKWYVFGEKSVNPDTKSFLDHHGISYFIVPQSGHFMMDDQPQLFYGMLFNALAR